MTTYTYAILNISPEAYAEIKAKLLDEGYDNKIGNEIIDLHGIAFRAEPEPDGVHHCSCSAVHRCDINVHPDPGVHEALSNLVMTISAYDERTGSSSRVTVHSDRIDGDFHSHTFNSKNIHA